MIPSNPCVASVHGAGEDQCSRTWGGSLVIVSMLPAACACPVQAAAGAMREGSEDSTGERRSHCLAAINYAGSLTWAAATAPSVHRTRPRLPNPWLASGVTCEIRGTCLLPVIPRHGHVCGRRYHPIRFYNAWWGESRMVVSNHFSIGEYTRRD